MDVSRKIGIAAFGNYSADVTDEPKDLKKMLVESGEPRPRRTNRFTDLALLGVHRALHDYPSLPTQCGIFLGSEQSNMCDTGEMLAAILQRGERPKPFDFINVSNNLAGYHIANRYGLEGANVAISRRGAAFESAMEMALLQLESGSIPMALVGAVDESCSPLAHHRTLIQQNNFSALAEGSSWFLLVAGDAAKQCKIGIDDYRRFSHWQKLSAYLMGYPTLSDFTFIVNEHLLAKIKQIGVVGEHLWHSMGGYFPAASAYSLSSILADGDRSPTLYIHGDDEAGYLLLQMGG